MLHKLLLFAGKTAIVMLGLAIIGTLLIHQFHTNLGEFYMRVVGQPLSSEARKKVEQESKLVIDGHGAYGSGCEITPGFVVTARHMVADVVLDRNIGIATKISWDGKNARVYSYSSANADYAVITTTPTGTVFPIEAVSFSKIPLQEGQILHTFSNPGDIPKLYQKLEIMKIKPGSDATTPTTITFKTDYTQIGMSGGCVYDQQGNFVGIIKTKKHYADPDAMHFGEITVINHIP